jgi:porphyrinogen peroxidase
MTNNAAEGPDPAPQSVATPLTRAAIFLVVLIKPGTDNSEAARALCGDLSALVRAVAFRDIEANLCCVMGLGAQAWDRLAGPPRPDGLPRPVGLPRPAGLHPFREIHAGSRHAVATPGDILFHIRAARMDLCFELATQIMARLGDAVSAADEVHGFRYFDDRDLIGFVDGTENPAGPAAAEATIIGAEDPAFAGGSYVIVQKYLHDLPAWNALSTEDQERIIGRTKLADIELDDAVKPTSAHNALTTIVEDGRQIQIVRDNMPFGSVSRGDFGTYFIGYARSPAPIEQMLVNMFVGRPPGNYDRLLDFSRAVTGTLFFVPSLPLLESLADGGPAGNATTGDAPAGNATTGDAPAGNATTGDAPAGNATTGDAPAGNATTGDAPTDDAATGAAPGNAGTGETATGSSETSPPSAPEPPARDGSLGIGSLRGESQHE